MVAFLLKKIAQKLRLQLVKEKIVPVLIFNTVTWIILALRRLKIYLQSNADQHYSNRNY